MMAIKSIKNYFSRQVSIAPLVSFRILFGLLMCFSVIRFAANGWIQSQYLEPAYFFSWPAFSFLSDLALHYSATLIYPLFIVMGLAALGIMLGYWYRLSCLLFFISFTWVELIDKTNYLNHYYFVSLISFLLIFLPAGKSFSMDVRSGFSKKVANIPGWIAAIIPLQLALVYFFAGAAKINTDWLLYAMPMKIWLPAQSHIPLVGELFTRIETAYFFSWGGAIYDLTIPLFLIWNKSRPFAFATVVFFHVLTAILFPIGVFPWIMISASLIFFSGSFHLKIHNHLRRISGSSEATAKAINLSNNYQPHFTRLALSFAALWFLVQLIVPLRSHLYEGDVKWHEKGYRFSWRVMLMEKAGFTDFNVKSDQGGYVVNASDYLTLQQEKMMATQPDMIVQFSHFVYRKAVEQGVANPRVYANSWVTLNGSRSQLFMDSESNLAEVNPAKAYRLVLPQDKQNKSRKKVAAF